MIKSFKRKESEKIFNRTCSKKLSVNIQSVAFRKLRMLNRAMTLNDLRVPPVNHLEKLKDDRCGQHGIRINKQWRICFVWKRGDVSNVEIVDYH